MGKVHQPRQRNVYCRPVTALGPRRPTVWLWQIRKSAFVQHRTLNVTTRDLEHFEIHNEAQSLPIDHDQENIVSVDAIFSYIHFSLGSRP